MKSKREQAQENVKQAKELLAKAELELEEVENVKFPQEGEYFSGIHSVEKCDSTFGAELFRTFNKEKVAKISDLENMIQRVLRQTADELCPDYVDDVDNEDSTHFIDITRDGLKADYHVHYTPLGAVCFDTKENTKIAIERIEPMYKELQELWGWDDRNNTRIYKRRRRSRISRKLFNISE